MRRIEINECTVGIRLGYRQENEWDVVVYHYPDDWTGEVQVYYRPPRERQSYPVSQYVQDYDNKTVTWKATAADLAKSGTGSLEYMMLDNGVVAKSKVFEVLVASDIISASTDAPEQWQSWVDTLAALGAVVTEAAHEAAVSEANAATSEQNAATSEANAAESADAAAASAAGAASSAAAALASEEAAEHYAEVAQQGAEESGYAWFDIHDNDGNMYVTVTANLAETTAFHINENSGELEVIVNG